MENTPSLSGLTSAEAAQRLLAYGPNAIEEKRQNLWLLFLKKFWAPVPWMLEATIALELILGKVHESLVIAALLLFNSALSFLQENKANKALGLLRRNLDLDTRALRDGKWTPLSARELVPSDIIYLRMGDLSPADVRLREGSLLVDPSALTGESLPVESKTGSIVYAGSMIKRGAATGEVIATGNNTHFGKTAQLIQTAKPVSHITQIIFSVIKYLLIVDIALMLMVFVYALSIQLPLIEILPYLLILLMISIPVALPAMFTLATAVGSTDLAKRGVLVTNLSAIEDAATMEVLCCDKTGTITKNQLQVTAVKSFNAHTEHELVCLAALACDEATQDPIDKAVFAAIQSRGLQKQVAHRTRFIPFDPEFKRSGAIFEAEGKQLQVIMGAPDRIGHLASNAQLLNPEVSAMALQGYRVLAIAVGPYEEQLDFVGLIAFNDPPREDSSSLIEALKQLGIKILMLTGDGLETAKNIAQKVGIGSNVRGASVSQLSDNQLVDCDVFAGLLPEDKYRLVQAIQRSGKTVGMTGDGVNDAPALKQAEVGIAVANATDIAKASASIILTQPGLNGIVAAVETSRRIYQRMHTYILNKITKSFEIGIFLSLGILFTDNFVITPLMAVLLLFTNDFVTMSIATDNVSFSHKPERWKISNLITFSTVIASLILIVFFSIIYFGRHVLHLSLPQLQTLAFVMLVFSGQGNVYLLRERRHFWSSAPGKWMMLASALDIGIVLLLATQGVLMAPIGLGLFWGTFLLIALYLVLVDFLKIRLVRHLMEPFA